MNIGEKIRDLRVSKLMTQSELAGTRITRNMLSCIENGTAQPSLPTLLYIAGRLNVPAGFLLAEEGDERVYRKMNSLANIKRAYTAGDWQGCRSLCLSACPEPDDEINLLLAECDAEIAVQEFERGRLRFSCRFFDEAISYAEKTVYRTDYIPARASVYFRFMQRISATLYSDLLDEEQKLPVADTSEFAAYVTALEELDQSDRSAADRFLAAHREPSFFAQHLKIKLEMLAGEYASAGNALQRLLRGDKPLTKIELYTVFSELEICCRETEDFKGAYSYANEKIRLLEQLLEET